MEKWELLERIREVMSDECILEDLINALSTDDAIDNLNWIAKQYDISLTDEEDED